MRIVSAAATLFFALPALAQQHSARDAFWSASDLVAVSANPGSRPASAPPPVKHRQSAPVSNVSHVDPVLIAQNGYGSQPHFVKVSDDQIGVRYSVMLRDSNGKYNEVSPTATFHSGDLLHLSVMSNQPGYLYVIQQGSSGSWSPIFPAKGSAPESNKVEQGKVTEIPAGSGAFKFDATPGQEKLFIVVSRKPIQDLDQTISGLKTPGGTNNANAPKNAPDMSAYEASNKLPDELQKRFGSRDLQLVENVDDTKRADNAGEKAVYVVSTASVSSAGPQVVAALTLHHE